jgi:hypothetical protein
MLEPLNRNAGTGLLKRPFELIRRAEGQPRQQQNLMRMPDEVRNGVKESLHHRDVKALNLPSEAERPLIQVLNDAISFLDDYFKSSHQLFAGESIRRCELGGAIAIIRLCQNSSDTPLLEISRQMQQ